MEGKERKSTPCFGPWILRHRSLILPLLGDTKIARRLDDAELEDITLNYEELSQQPNGIRVNLRSHQIEGVSFLRNLRNNNAHGILADEMGLGKTIQVLSFFQHVMNLEKGDGRPFLVICPLSVLDSWAKEISTWTTLRAAYYHGIDDKRRSVSNLVRRKEVDVVVTTYETAVRDAVRLIRMTTWKCVVLDEGHRIKNSETKLSKSIRNLKTDQKIILTGTPIQNNLSETWSILNWLYADIFDKQTQSSFQEAFNLTEGRVDPVFIQHVKDFLEIIMLRRTKEIAADLPPKKEVIIYLPLTKLQKNLYLEVLTGIVHGMESATNYSDSHLLQTPPSSPGGEDVLPSTCEPRAGLGNGTPQSVLNILMELRKICVHPLLTQNVEIPDENNELDISSLISMSSKFIFLRRLIEEEVVKNKKKMLVFSGFDYALDCCENVLEDLSIQHVRLDGRTAFAMRKYNVHRFMKTNCQVFIMATRAGGEGITLTAAEVVVFLDMDFNPQVTAQAEARAHRIGQTKPVTVYKICTRGTVESQMMHRIGKKLYLASKIMDCSTNTTSSDMDMDNVPADSVFIRNLIRSSAEAISSKGFTPESLLDMSWPQVLESCKGNQEYEVEDLVSPPPSPSVSQGGICLPEEETSWLSRKGRIQTGLFDGKLFRRRPAVFNHEISNTPLDPTERRKNKNRVIFDEDTGFFINKESTQCEQWQAIPTFTAANANSSDKKESRVEIEHLKACLICGHTRNVQECAYCPQVYHNKCTAPSFSQKKLNQFQPSVCPQHKCTSCRATANDAGGLLLVCTKCPRAYCVDCVDLDGIQPVDQNPTFTILGYKQPKHVQFITCMGCNAGSRKRSANGCYDGRLRSSKRNRTI